MGVKNWKGEQLETKISQYDGVPTVAVIPATKRFVQNGGQLRQQDNIRVAAYCRVSTGDESQQTSYTKQKEFYTMLIQRRQGWRFAGIYADEAISGTSRARRVEFNRMMDDALEGKLDYIVTKSISRFARNTVDTLNCVRQLQQQNPPVGIYFEKENIDTLDAKGELILTILSALAQDESRSISDNIRWTFQKKFQEGKPQLNLKRMLGYDKGNDGRWVINPSQAEIVRYIFERFLYGCSANKIAKELNEMGRYTVNGKKWRSDGVFTVLKNEKYVGDLEMQKTVTKDFLSHRSVINTGEAPKYYVRDHHIPIIDRMTWERVQAILLERGYKSARKEEGQAVPVRRKGPHKSPFARLRCGAMVNGNECGEGFVRITYTRKAANYSDERSFAAWDGGEMYTELYAFAYPVWKCKCKIKKHMGKQCGCSSALLYECAVEQSFMEMLYALKLDWEHNGEGSVITRLFEASYGDAKKKVKDMMRSGNRLEMLDMQIGELEKNLQKMNERQSIIGWEADCYDSITNIRERISKLQKEKQQLEEEQDATLLLKQNFEFFLKCLRALPAVNAAGMTLNVHGLDEKKNFLSKGEGGPKKEIQDELVKGDRCVMQELVNKAPDYLHFEKGMYIAFIRDGTVRGDVIEYTTNFGVKLTSTGNSRTLSSFLGYRRGREDGTVEILTETWQVNDRKIQYRRKKAGEEGPVKNKN